MLPKLKFFENSLTYWIMFKLKARRLLPGPAGTFIPFVGSSRQLAGYTLWTCLVHSDLSGHEESLLLLSPAGNGCPLLRPWHRNWLHVQLAPCRTGSFLQTCFSLQLQCNWEQTHRQLLYLSWRVATFYLTPTKAGPPFIARLHFLVVGQQSFHWLQWNTVSVSSTVPNFRH